jgi:hypothetical protein
MADNEYDPIAVPAKGNPAVFGLTVISIEDGYGIGIKENSRSSGKTHLMFFSVLPCLAGIPFEMISHFRPRIYAVILKE